jgi:hypothetical protein
MCCCVCSDDTCRPVATLSTGGTPSTSSTTTSTDASASTTASSTTAAAPAAGERVAVTRCAHSHLSLPPPPPLLTGTPATDANSDLPPLLAQTLARLPALAALVRCVCVRCVLTSVMQFDAPAGPKRPMTLYVAVCACCVRVVACVHDGEIAH